MEKELLKQRIDRDGDLFEAFGNLCQAIIESRTESNMNLISSFVELVRKENAISIPETTILKFFNA